MSKVLGFLVAGAEIAVGAATGNIALIATGVGSLVAATIAALQHLPKPEQTESAIKAPIPPRIKGYGRNRLHMAYTLFATASDGRAVDVGVYHDGRVDGIESYYLGDIPVTLSGGFVQVEQAIQSDGSLKPTGQFGDHSDLIQIETRLGLPTETALGSVISAMPSDWTSDHRGDGCMTASMISAPVKSKYFQRNYPSGGPNATPLSMAMRLSPVFDWGDATQSLADPTTWKWSENACLHLVDYLLTCDNKDWATHFAPTLALWTAAANDCDVPMPLHNVQTIITAPAPHGSGHLSLSSLNGLANGTVITISATGNTSITETRTITGVSGNVVALDSGLSHDHPQGSQVTWTGANATEPRYRSCLVFKLTDARKDVKAGLLACFDGWLSSRSDGALVCYSGRYVPPTVTIGPDEITDYSIQDGVEEESAVNQITLSYVSANHAFNTVDTDPWEDDDDIATRGKVVADSLANQVPSHSQARRLAKRKMAQIMAPKRGTVTTNSAGRIVRGQRFIHLDLIDADTIFYSGPVEVQKLIRNLSTGGVTFDWLAVDPNVDAWDPATEEGEPAPVGNRVALAPLDAPVITAAVVNFGAQAADGASGAYLELTVVGLNRADVTWYARTRQVGAAVWGERTYSDLDAGASVTLATEFVPTDSSVEVEVSYGTGDGNLSPWSATLTVDTHTDTTAPDAATAPTLVSWGTSLNVQTSAVPRARMYRWRLYKADGTTLIATRDTTDRSLSYTAAQAATDGAQRSYVVKVCGVNAAGEGVGAASGALTNPAPATVASPAIAGGATTATGTCTASSDPDVTGYALFYAISSGFDPVTTGGVVTSGTPSVQVFGLAAGTYYGRLAVYDSWTGNPALLNLSGEMPFTITTGGGSTPSGGGTDGGGYDGGGGGYGGQLN